MRIFIFKPAKIWDYCGGGLVAIAKNYDQVVNIIKENDSERELFQKEPNKEDCEHTWETWVLVDSFELVTGDEGVVMEDYNWA